MGKARVYGTPGKKITRRPQDMRYQRQQRQRQGATRKPVAGQIIKEKEEAKV